MSSIRRRVLLTDLLSGFGANLLTCLATKTYTGVCTTDLLNLGTALTPLLARITAEILTRSVFPIKDRELDLYVTLAIWLLYEKYLLEEDEKVILIRGGSIIILMLASAKALQLLYG